MASIEELSKAIDLAKSQRDYEVVEVLVDRLRQEVGKGGGGAGFFENVGTGLASGAVGMYESAALGGAALFEEEEELKARDKIKRVAESFRPDGGDKESLTYKLASGIGSIGALLPTALLGPAALPLVLLVPYCLPHYLAPPHYLLPLLLPVVLVLVKQANAHAILVLPKKKEVLLRSVAVLSA
jgi:hypothetical protein